MSHNDISPTKRLWMDDLRVFWKFSRPHTIIGTTLSVAGLAIIALADSLTRLAEGSSTLPSMEFSWIGFVGIVLGALVPSLCANVYIVGLNQLEDVPIDRINKPALPLASGEFSKRQGLVIVAITGVLALLLAGLQGSILFLTVLLSVLIGTAYSLPPIRLKRFPFWAALCIFGVRGLIVNIGFFLYFQQRFNAPMNIPLQVWALTVFVVLFAFAIAIFKDIPDAKGDQEFKIATLTLKLGIPKVFKLALGVLTGCYCFMIALATLGAIPVQPLFLISTHIGLLAWLWIRSTKVNLNDKQQITQFYQFIWKLFFLEYILYPVACLQKVYF
ncbi:MAG TPA: homogentisate phytyltransferase [Stenomitos sp.]